MLSFILVRSNTIITPASADPEGGQGVRTPLENHVIWVSIGNKQLGWLVGCLVVAKPQLAVVISRY